MTQHLLRIGEVAAQAGVSTRTVDYYTSLGLIAPAARTTGSFRLYAPAVVERITTIRQLELLGIPLDQIASVLTAPGTEGLAALLARLDHDLHTLRQATDGTSAETQDLLIAAVTRAHQLVSAALDIAANIPSGI